MPQITITVGNIVLRCETFDSPTATAILAELPIEGHAMTWGDEVYFSTPVSVAREPDAKEVVQPGEIAFWPDGDAIAIGFGETPISAPGEIRLASPCNIWARALDDVTALKDAQAGDRIEVRLAE